MRPRSRGHTHGWEKTTIALAMVLVLAAGGVYRLNAEVQALAEYQTGHAQLVPRSDLLSYAVTSWDFSRGVDSDWSLLGGARATVRGGLVIVETGPEKYTYQMWTTAHRLAAGKYQFTVEGRPTNGGLYLGALDATLNQWVTTANYWSDQDGYDKGIMAVTFALATPTEMRFVISNWNPRSERSTWSLAGARLYTATLPLRELLER